MGAMAYQITSLTIVYSTVYSSAAQRKRQSCASLDFLCGEFTGHRASNTENNSIWWRHHAWRKTVSHSIRLFFLSWRTVSPVWQRPFLCDLILRIESRLKRTAQILPGKYFLRALCVEKSFSVNINILFVWSQLQWHWGVPFDGVNQYTSTAIAVYFRMDSIYRVYNVGLSNICIESSLYLYLTQNNIILG